MGWLDANAMDTTIKFISQLGFPVFVAVLLLFQVERMHRTNTRAISQLTSEIAQLRTQLSLLIEVLRRR